MRLPDKNISSLATSKKNLIMNYFFEIKSKAFFFKDIVFLFFPITSKRDIILNNAQRDKTHIRRYELYFMYNNTIFLFFLFKEEFGDLCFKFPNKTYISKWIISIHTSLTYIPYWCCSKNKENYDKGIFICQKKKQRHRTFSSLLHPNPL